MKEVLPRNYEEFHAVSRIEGRYMASETWVNPASWPKEWTQIDFKTYPRMDKIELPLNKAYVDTGLIECLHRRESSSEQTQNNLDIDKLGFILGNAFGLRQRDGQRSIARRVYPSAGARFPLELYVFCQHCEGVSTGIYHYNVRDHCLESIFKGEFDLGAVYGYEWIAKSKMALVVTAMIKRSFIKYGERAYRFVHLEAGHAIQNVCLLSTNLNISMKPVGGFADEPLSRLLDLHQSEEFPIYSAVFP